MIYTCYVRKKFRRVEAPLLYSLAPEQEQRKKGGSVSRKD